MFNRMKAIRKRGFNLIEAAIVLGVVGAVIGGIWSAAASVIENYKFNKLREDTLIYARKIQNLISSMDSALIPYENITSYLVSAGAYPKDWTPINSNTALLSPSGLITNNYNLPSTKGFTITFIGISKAQCVRLIPLFADGHNKDILNILVQYTDTTYEYLPPFSWPISINTAKDICSAKPLTYLGLFFEYTRNNN